MIYHDNHIIDIGFAAVVHKLTGCKIVNSSKSHDELTSVLIGKYKYYFDYKEEISIENIKELEKSLEYNLGFKMIIEKKLSNENNPPKFKVKFFDNQKNIKNINCFSNEGDNWGNPNISVDENNIMKISFREKFTFRRGRLNCSLNESGKWKWFGHQFTIQIPK